LGGHQELAVVDVVAHGNAFDGNRAEGRTGSNRHGANDFRNPPPIGQPSGFVSLLS
jgi:hypothetical protein